MPIETVDIDALIRAVAEKYGLNEEHFEKVMGCESGGFTDIAVQNQYRNPDGTQERSFSIAQINLDAHPEVTYAEATDPYLPWIGPLRPGH